MNYKIAPTYYTRLLAILEQATPGTTLLNAGCGTGEFNYYLRDRFQQSYGVDINEADITTARELCPDDRIRYDTGDVARLSFEDDFFDTVICVEVLEHVEQPAQVLAELRRVLKPGGQLIVTVPHKNYPFCYDPLNFVRERLTRRHFPIGIWGFGHTKLFSSDQMIGLIEDAGFSVLHSELLTHSLCGLLEMYIPTILQPFFKSNTKNQQDEPARRSKEKLWHFSYDIPKGFSGGLKRLIAVDHWLGRNSKHGVGILVKATLE